ncbi:MAG: hypothetical protein ACRDUA_26230 [Micromonosporaceae bacterium]
MTGGTKDDGVNVTARPVEGRGGSKVDEEILLGVSGDPTCASPPFVFEFAGRSWACHDRVPPRLLRRIARVGFGPSPGSERRTYRMMGRLGDQLLDQAVVEAPRLRVMLAAHPERRDELEARVVPALLTHFSQTSADVGAYAARLQRMPWALD